MSLLTSSSINREHKKFLNKMERFYHRRAGSNFIPREKPQFQPQITTKIQSAAIIKIQDLMSKFMKQIGQVIRQFDNIDHYNVLQILRKHQFFSDVTAIMEMDLHIRIQQLEKSNEKQAAEIKQLKKQIKQAQSQGRLNIDEAKIQYNSNKSIAANLYYHARAMNQTSFINFYNKISLSSPIQIQKIYHKPESNMPNGQEDISSLLGNIQEMTMYAQNANNQSLLKEIIQKIQQLLSKKSKHCKRPCCADTGNDDIVRLNKAKTLMNTTFSKGRQSFYKNDKSEEYFTRYYRGSSFNVNEITSVTRTKREEMDRLQELYRKNLKLRNKSNNHRYSASYALQ